MVSKFGRAHEIPESVAQEMIGRSYRDDPKCPHWSELRLLSLSHWDFSGQIVEGELVIAASVADETLAIFEALFAARFPIARMRRIDFYEASDDASMADNNCSAFNFRYVHGTDVLSHHALGLAIDINPIQNPWVRGERIDPPAGKAFLDRSLDHPAMIKPDGPVVRAFARYGWDWGGFWSDVLDYHHFSKLPR